VAAGCSAPPLTDAARVAVSNVGRGEETDLLPNKETGQGSRSQRAVPAPRATALIHQQLRIRRVSFHERKWSRSRERRGKDIEAALRAHCRALRATINERVARVADFLPGHADLSQQVPTTKQATRPARIKLRLYEADGS